MSPFAGTTRDVIEVHFDLNGYPVTLLDTAGIRDTRDPVEMEGVRRARERAAEADLVLWLVEAGQPASAAPPRQAGQTVWTLQSKADIGLARNELPHQKKEHIFSNTSLTDVNLTITMSIPSRSENMFINNECKFISRETNFAISAATADGIDQLSAALAKHAEEFFGSGEPALLTRERHRVALQASLEALQRALAEAIGTREDLIAEELRVAARALGKLVGRVDVEDILDVIFRDFCIGK